MYFALKSDISSNEGQIAESYEKYIKVNKLKSFVNSDIKFMKIIVFDFFKFTSKGLLKLKNNIFKFL